MSSPLLSYAQAAEEVTLFLLSLGKGSSSESESSLSRRAAQSYISSEKLPLNEALGRVLMAEIRADRDQPPFPRSTRDGFACRAAEANTHQLLFVAGQLRAGQSPPACLASGEVWEIMTGAPVPLGADAVFMVEHAELSSNFVRLCEPRTIQAGDNIVPQAAEAQTGQILLESGTRIGPAQIALAAMCGYSEVMVAARPRVAVLATGDELVPVKITPGPSQIRNSNAPMLAALVSAAGGVPVVLPPAADTEEAVTHAIQTAVSPVVGADLLLVTGGISAGRFDLVKAALEQAGARFFFGGVAIQPGKPVVFGQLPRSAGSRSGSPLPFFALPGNPISSAVTFHLFAAPLLAALSNDTAAQPRFAMARMKGNWRGSAGLTRFLPAVCDFDLPGRDSEEGIFSQERSQARRGPQVRLVPWQGSGDLAAYARANCLVVIPPEADELLEASAVAVLLT